MRTTFVAAAVASLLLMVSATVWEGVSARADLPEPDAPENYSVATNSFPPNTIVDITNLENGKMVRVLVVSGFETTGLLAALSPHAADVVDLRGNSTCRIRMTLPPDSIAYSKFRLGPIGGAKMNTRTITEVSMESAETESAETLTAFTADEITAETSADTANDNSVDTITYHHQSKDTGNDTEIVPHGTYSAEFIPTEFIPTESTPTILAESQPEYLAADNSPAGINAAMSLSLTPAENRLPQPPSRVVMVPLNNEARPVVLPETSLMAMNVYAVNDVITTTEYIPAAEAAPFRAPLIKKLEPGKWYVQVAVYTRSDHVEDAIGRIGTGYPVAVEKTGADTKPLFRVLLGPMQRGESAAVLRRFKSIGYTDAFLRNG